MLSTTRNITLASKILSRSSCVLPGVAFSKLFFRKYNSDISSNVTKLTQADPVGSYSSLIDILFKEGYASEGQSLIQQLQDHAAGVSSTSGAHVDLTDTELNFETAINFNNAIITAANSGNVKRAEAILKEMKDKNFTPSCEAYNALTRFYATKQRDWKRVYELISEMSHCGITKDIHVFNVIIRGFVNNLDMTSAIHSFNQMLDEEVRPNVATFNAMIDGFTRKGWKSESELWFSKLKEYKLNPTINTYNMLVEFFARTGDISGALRYVKYLREAGLQPDQRTWTALLEGYTHTSNWSLGYSVWESHLRPSDTFIPNGLNAISENAVSAFLRLCAASGQGQRAFKEWEYLKNSGILVRPSVANCNELINCYLKNRMFSEAKKVLFEEMKRGDDVSELGFFAKPVASWKTYLKLLSSFAKENRMRELDEIKVVMFAHDQQVVETVVEELPQLFSVEEKLITKKN
ncbi:hypothetical protein HK096_005005 [Nowakowskiella sp. JEL0078]|nr:hypothetical protein HK096_005005 [Nowakowskiella sp. JEL0078]